jgi:uncharacterized damage-inducible protein DinB
MTTTEIQRPQFTDVLVEQFALTYRVAHANLAGVSQEESLQHPQPAGNNMHWIVRHIVTVRDKFLPALGTAPVLTLPADSLRVEELLATLDESQKRLLPALKTLTNKKLSEEPPFSPGSVPIKTLGLFLATTAFHEAYHCGQLGILRRLLGKAGAV